MISDTMRARLVARQEELLEWFLEHSDTAKWPDISTAQGRGDLKWFLASVSTAVGIAARIEGLLPDAPIRHPEDEAATDQVAKAAMKKAEALMKRMSRA